jgi:hypothetical protein
MLVGQATEVAQILNDMLWSKLLYSFSAKSAKITLRFAMTHKASYPPAEEADPGAAYSDSESICGRAACCVCARIASRWRTGVDVMEDGREVAYLVGR